DLPEHLPTTDRQQHLRGPEVTMSQQNTTPVVAELDEAAFDALTADVAVPIEQSRVWEAFDAATPGRRPWGVYAIRSGEQTWCVIRLSAYQGRGFSYLWAKHGPVWLVEVTRERESQVRRLLVEHIRSLRPRTAFLRLHGRYRAEDTHE